MTRPRSAPIEKPQRYSVTMPRELLDRLKKAAAADNRSISAWMIPHLEAAVEAWEAQKGGDPSEKIDFVYHKHPVPASTVQEDPAPDDWTVFMTKVIEKQEKLSNTVMILVDKASGIRNKEQLIESLKQPSSTHAALLGRLRKLDDSESAQQTRRLPP